MTAHNPGLIRRWVGGALFEAAARTLILTGTTALLARLLAPADFGAAALVLTVVAIFSVCVGTPYEEALAQRRVLRAADLRAALAASLLAGVLFTAVAWPAGLLMGHVFGRHDLAQLLPVATLQVFGQASLSISTAVARRRRAFNTINVASLGGHLTGAAVAMAMAWAGAGIWALIGLRVGIVLGSALVLQALLGLWLRPQWSWERVHAFHGFAAYVLLSRLLENFTYLIYNFMVGQLFGLPVLGFVNMALRIVEPLRGAIAAITHNLCFAHFVRVSRDPVRTADGIVAISSQSALLSAPMFMGVASVSPVLIPLLAGPGWGPAAPIAATLACGSMLLLPSQIALTALSAMGQPKRGLTASAIGTLTTVLVLVAVAGMNPVWVGVARLLGDAVQATAAVALGARLLPLSKRALLGGLAASWSSAAAMAVGVLLLTRTVPTGMPLGFVLVLDVVGGVCLYGLAALLLARASLLELFKAMRAKPASPSLQGGTA